MTYTIKTNSAEWKIEPGLGETWLLKRKVGTQWMPIETCSSAEEAAAMVAKGTTGQKDWDSRAHNPADFALEKWEWDTTGIASV